MWTRLAVKKERIEPYEYWVRSTLLAAFDVIELRPDALDRLEAFHGDACALHKSSLTSVAQRRGLDSMMRDAVILQGRRCGNYHTRSIRTARSTT